VNIADKYWICRLKYRRWRFSAWYKRERAKLIDMKAPDDEVGALDADTQLTLGQIQDEIDCINSTALSHRRPFELQGLRNAPISIPRLRHPQNDSR
jgi:hypothetical protein